MGGGWGSGGVKGFESYMDKPRYLLNFTVEAQNTGVLLSPQITAETITQKPLTFSTIATTGTDTAADSFAARFALLCDAWVRWSALL